jgi:hypothetical protein
LPPGLPESFPGTYKDVSKGGAICAVRSSGELVCWGNDRYFLPAPAGSFEQVAVGEEAACARRADQTVACWGNPVRAYYVPPAYTFESLTGGAYFVCGLAAIGHAAICWEPRVGAESVFGVQGPFTQVDTGRFFACGLRPDGSVSCWSASWPPGGAPDANSYGELQPVQGPFRELTVGEFHACGLRADGQVACWGADSYGQATPPAGAVFLQVSAGSYHTCGIVPDGSVTCWGGGASCGG